MYKIKPLEWTINNTASNGVVSFYIDLWESDKYTLNWFYLKNGVLESDKIRYFKSIDVAKERAEIIYENLVLDLLIKD